jgi:hypothetical protein
MKSKRRWLWFSTVFVLCVLGVIVFAGCGEEEEEAAPTTVPTVEVPTEEPSPVPDTPTGSPVAESPTPTSPSPIPAVTRPEANEAVSMETQVEVRVDPPDLGDFQLYVLVRPIPTDPNQQYWVQAAPVSIGEGLWESDPVYVGRETDTSGTPFGVCAVLTRETLSRGDSLDGLPDGPSHCIDVTRE